MRKYEKFCKQENIPINKIKKLTKARENLNEKNAYIWMYFDTLIIRYHEIQNMLKYINNKEIKKVISSDKKDVFRKIMYVWEFMTNNSNKSTSQ